MLMSLRILNALGGWWEEFAIWFLETLLDCEEREKNCNLLGFKVHGLGHV
jgi:hypothetical protein